MHQSHGLSLSHSIFLIIVPLISQPYLVINLTQFEDPQYDEVEAEQEKRDLTAESLNNPGPVSVSSNDYAVYSMWEHLREYLKNGDNDPSLADSLTSHNSSLLRRNRFTGKNRLSCFYHLSNPTLSFSSSSTYNHANRLPLGLISALVPSRSGVQSLPSGVNLTDSGGMHIGSRSSVSFQAPWKDYGVSSDLDIYDPFDNENMRI